MKRRYRTNRRTKNTSDYFLGGGKLGPWVAALSASASSSSAWTLLGVSGAAYLWGLPALWLFPATLSGFMINWIYIAPRLSEYGRNINALTLTDVLATGHNGESIRIIRWIASSIILFCFMFIYFMFMFFLFWDRSLLDHPRLRVSPKIKSLTRN